METAETPVTTPTNLDKQLHQNIAGATAPITAQTSITSQELQIVGAKAVDDDSSPLQEALEVIGSELKYARADVTGESKIRQGKAKRFLVALKGRILRKAKEQGGEVKAV